MKIEYDAVRDLLYLWFGTPGERAAKTETAMPGVHPDFDRDGRLLGIEVLDAAEVLRHKVQFEVSLTPPPRSRPPRDLAYPPPSRSCYRTPPVRRIRVTMRGRPMGMGCSSWSTEKMIACSES